MNYTHCVPRKDPKICQYVYLNPFEDLVLPDWIESYTEITEDEDTLLYSFKLSGYLSQEEITANPGELLVYSPIDETVTVLDMDAFVDRYQRVED